MHSDPATIGTSTSGEGLVWIAMMKLVATEKRDSVERPELFKGSLTTCDEQDEDGGNES